MVDGPNLYVYLANNPINDIDPWGLCGGAGGGWGFFDELKDWWNKLYPAPFKWWDITSWVFPGTNYGGITKSGPGPELSSFDQACHRHDDCIKQTHDDFWDLANPEIRECHNDFISGN